MKTYELTDAARGVIRRSGEVIAYDYPAGPVDASEMHPLVRQRLGDSGVMVPVKQAPAKEDKQ
jgi:hypothetical protein